MTRATAADGPEPPSDSTGAAPRGIAIAGALAATGAGLAAALRVLETIARLRGPLVWDEGGYLMRAWIASEGVHAGSLAMAWGGAVLNPYYPPLAAWLLAPALLIGGAREAAAFGFSAVCFAACALLLWVTGRRIGGPLAGAIAVLFLLGSRLHLEYVATVMLEVPGTALTLLGVWLTLRHIERPRPASAWLAGGAIAALFLYKYNFGLFLAAAAFASEAMRPPRRPFAAATLGLWLPLVVLGAAWCLVPGKLAGLLEYSGNRRSDLGPAATLLYYPRQLVSYYAAWPPAGWLAIAGALGALALARRAEIRFLLILAGVGLASMTIHPYKIERSIATVVPALWLLAGAAAARLVRALSANPLRARLVAGTAALVLILPLPALYRRDLPAIAESIATHRPHPWSRFPWPGRDLLGVQDRIVAAVDPALPVYIAGEFNELSPTVLWWQLSVRYPRTPVMNRCDQPETVWAPPLTLVTIELLPGSRYFNDDYRMFNAPALDWIHPFERTGARPRIDTTFADAGLRLRIYRLDQAPRVGAK